jgi:hypothetical protein
MAWSFVLLSGLTPTVDLLSSHRNSRQWFHSYLVCRARGFHLKYNAHIRGLLFFSRLIVNQSEPKQKRRYSAYFILARYTCHSKYWLCQRIILLKHGEAVLYIFIRSIMIDVVHIHPFECCFTKASSFNLMSMMK